MKNPDFNKFSLPLTGNLFQQLSNTIDFENVGKGRQGNHLVNIGDKGIPIVRTTTKYNKPAHNFSAIHHNIIEKINQWANGNDNIQSPLSFNNALIEIYDWNYFKMKYHSDQCLDLATNSYIALFSCYERPEELTENNLRKLKVKNKVRDKELEFVLENNSVVLFSLETNTSYLHKIVLDAVSKQKPIAEDNRWLGITFRRSKTHIQFKDTLPYFPNGTMLSMANEMEQKEFYTLRGQENKVMNFTYPDINYTLNQGDLIQPIDH